MSVSLGGYVDTGVGGTSHTPQNVGVTLLRNISDAQSFGCKDRTYSVSLIGGEILPERVSGVENGEKTDNVDLGRAAGRNEHKVMKEKYGKDLHESSTGRSLSIEKDEDHEYYSTIQSI
jgi:hypothetical protein